MGTESAPRWYLDWAKGYGAVWGMTSEGDIEMLAAWWSILRCEAWTQQELQQAGQAVANDPDPPRWRSDHWPRLIRALRRVRSASIASQSAPQQGEQCVTCSGTGYVAGLPHPAHVRRDDNAWCSKYTIAAYCACRLGEWMRQRAPAVADVGGRKVARMIGLVEYSNLVPHWRSLIACREAARAEEARVSAPPPGGSVFDQVVRRQPVALAPPPLKPIPVAVMVPDDDDMPF